MIANILNGTVRPPAQTRQAGSWVLPVSPPSEIGFALKCARKKVVTNFQTAVETLRSIGQDANWISDEQLREIAGKTGSPVKYMRFSLARANQWMASIQEYVARMG